MILLCAEFQTTGLKIVGFVTIFFTKNINLYDYPEMAVF